MDATSIIVFHMIGPYMHYNLIRINILMACYCKIIVGILQYPAITAGSMVIEFASKK